MTRSSLPEMSEYIEEIREIWDSHWLTNMGMKHKTFQEKLKEYLGVEHIELFTNGHMALELSIQALRLQGEVITTPFTFVSTTHAIVRNGLTPVFCDVKADDFTIDPDLIESLITDKTCAIVPVHVYGNVCDVEAIEDIAKRHNLKVLYDAAHSFGCKYKGHSVSSYGDISCYSFHATKVFNTIEGGAAVYQDPVYGQRLYELKNFGILNETTINSVGANAKMNEFCAAMGLCNLRNLDESIASRKKAVMKYYEELDGIPGIRLNTIQKDLTPNYAYFPVIIDENRYGMTRDELAKTFAWKNIYPRKYFYPLTNKIDCYKSLFPVGYTPVAEFLSDRVLTLPLYEGMTEEDIKRVTSVIKENCSTV